MPYQAKVLAVESRIQVSSLVPTGLRERVDSVSYLLLFTYTRWYAHEHTYKRNK